MTKNFMALSFPNKSYAHPRIDLMHFTAAMPLFAINTCKQEKHQFGKQSKKALTQELKMSWQIISKTCCHKRSTQT